jgi:hypothetical protein
MTPLSMTAVLLLALGAGDRPGAPAKNSVGARVAAAERDLCLTGCPPIPATASSDWLRSPEGQGASGCQMTCRIQQPAAELYRELADLGGRGALSADAPLVRLAGKEGVELSRRLQAALKVAEGQRLGPLCARARETFGSRDEGAFLECIGRSARPEGQAASTPPDPTRALRCATALAEREADWLRRCTALEAKADIPGCTSRAEELAAARRQTAPNARVTCEGETIERLASAFRGRGAP